MVLPSTGTISFSDIQAEFGGTSPIFFSEYYAGGAYVPSGTSGVATTGQMAINSFRGKSKVIKPVASGGVVSTITDMGQTYTLHTFSYCNYPAGTTFTVTSPGSVELFIVGGGGGGGYGRNSDNNNIYGGGGGGGGSVTSNTVSLTTGTYSVGAGYGGGGGTWPTAGGWSYFKNSDSSILYFGYGGGYGGSPSFSGDARAGKGGDGGGGGGGSFNTATLTVADGGIALSNNPNANPPKGANGGVGYKDISFTPVLYIGGGGGGAAGINGDWTGITSTFNGTSMTYGTGGGGGINNSITSVNYVPSGGGYGGNTGSAVPTQGVDGTGGGGGGGGSGGGARGGQGVVYIRY